MDSPDHWKQERLPGGTIRWYLHADRPVSLPHNRNPSGMYVVKIWVILGAVAAIGIFAGILWRWL